MQMMQQMTPTITNQPAAVSHKLTSDQIPLWNPPARTQQPVQYDAPNQPSYPPLPINYHAQRVRARDQPTANLYNYLPMHYAQYNTVPQAPIWPSPQINYQYPAMNTQTQPITSNHYHVGQQMSNPTAQQQQPSLAYTPTAMAAQPHY